MARYFGHPKLDGRKPTPSTEAVSGMQPLIRQHGHAAFRAQDRVIGQSRRTLMRIGVDGDDQWLVPNTSADQIGGSRTHPPHNTPRAVAIGKWDVTPSCIPFVTCLHLPSGMTQSASGPDWVSAGVQGIVQFDCTFTASDATVESYVYVLPLEPSQLENGSENTSTGGMQKSYRLASMRLQVPVDMDDNVQRVRWSRPYAVEIEVRYVGSPRVVDLVISEVPTGYTLEADTDDTEWLSHIYADNVHPKYPCDEREDTSVPDADQRFGTLQALRVADNQRKRLGPQLFYWSAHRETGGDVDDTALPYVTIGTAASTRWINSLNTSQFATLSSAAAFEASEPGWSMGCGGYARSWLHNNDHVMPGQNVATAPVLLRVYAQNNAAATATPLRLHTAPDDAVASSANSEAAYSWIDLNIPAATGPDWFEAWGYVTVGVNPEQHVIAQLMVQQATSGTDLDIYAVEAYVWDGSYAPI